MLELPRFFRGKDRSDVLPKLKLAVCPHCRRANALICNGKLYGNDPLSHRTGRVVRGQRIRCSIAFQEKL